MSNELGLGRIIVGAAHRDAIHIAVAPVEAGEDLEPGQHVLLDATGRAMPLSSLRVGVGIVDPFLSVPKVKKGERFWLYLYPGSITALRHEWTHPAFREEIRGDGEKATTRMSDHEIWLRAYAMRVNRYDTPDEAFQRLIQGLQGMDLFFYGSDLHGLWELPDAEALREHAEAYLGKPIGDWGSFSFSCSC